MGLFLENSVHSYCMFLDILKLWIDKAREVGGTKVFVSVVFHLLNMTMNQTLL